MDVYFDIKDEQLPIIYSTRYDIHFMGMEKLHPFDSAKWGKIFRMLESNFCFIIYFMAFFLFFTFLFLFFSYLNSYFNFQYFMFLFYFYFIFLFYFIRYFLSLKWSYTAIFLSISQFLQGSSQRGQLFQALN